MEGKTKKQKGPVATSLWKAKGGGYFRLLFYEFPDAQSVLPPFPVDIKGLRLYRQALWIKADNPVEEGKPPFQGQIWLPPIKAFRLYEFIQGLFYGSEETKFKLMDDSKTVYFNKGDKHLLVITCVSEKGAGRVYLDHQSTFILASMIKGNAQMSLVIPDEETKLYVDIRRFGDWVYFSEPFMANVTSQEMERLKKFLEDYLKGGEEKDIKPVIVKDIYTFRYVPAEGKAYLVYPYGKIAIDDAMARRLLLLL